MISSSPLDFLSCYKCTSKSSWEDCNLQMTNITCPSGSSQCLNGTLNCTSGDEMAIIYYKHCSAPNKSCEIAKADLPLCPRSVPAWHFSHSENCCSGDNCNGDAPGASDRLAVSINTVIIAMITVLILWAV